MMKFALLCSGSKGNSFLLRDEHSCILVDCGSTKRYLNQCFEQLDFDPSEIDAVLITHDHSDHVAQVGTRHRNKVIARPDQRLAQKLDVVARPAAAARLGNQQRRLMNVILSRVQRIEELTNDDQRRRIFLSLSYGHRILCCALQCPHA